PQPPPRRYTTLFPSRPRCRPAMEHTLMAGSDKGKSNKGKSNRGNSRRKNLSKSGKGNPTAGSGGRGRRRLAGRGPTPPAEDRPHHKAYRQPSQHAGAGGRAAPRPARAEWVAGRNAVTELLRA